MDLSKHMLFQSVRLVGAVGIEPTLGISTTYEVGPGLKKKDLVVLGTLIAAAMPPFFP